LACAACGKETKAGVLFCAGCLSGLTDPLDLIPRLIDPTADARLLRMQSVSMRVFPTNGPSLGYSASLDAPLRLPSLVEHENVAAFPSFIDEYLSGIGVSLHLFGDELLPHRPFVWELIKQAEDAEIASEVWARASLRMANVHIMLVRASSRLAVDESWLTLFLKKHTGSALTLSGRSKDYPKLNRIASSNLQMMNAFLGNMEEAIAELAKLETEGDEDSHQITIKRAMLLMQVGKGELAKEALQRIPVSYNDMRVRRLRARLEGSG
jgi:hypothetical protein